jgi:hypothetical protein
MYSLKIYQSATAASLLGDSLRLAEIIFSPNRLRTTDAQDRADFL